MAVNDRSRDPRMPRATYRDPRDGTATPSAIAVAAAGRDRPGDRRRDGRRATFGVAVRLANRVVPAAQEI